MGGRPSLFSSIGRAISRRALTAPESELWTAWAYRWTRRRMGSGNRIPWVWEGIAGALRRICVCTRYPNEKVLDRRAHEESHVHMKRRAAKAAKTVSKGIRFAPDVLKELLPVARIRGFSAAVNEAVRERAARRRAVPAVRRKAS